MISRRLPGLVLALLLVGWAIAVSLVIGLIVWGFWSGLKPMIPHLATIFGASA